MWNWIKSQFQGMTLRSFIKSGADAALAAAAIVIINTVCAHLPSNILTIVQPYVDKFDALLVAWGGLKVVGNHLNTSPS